MERKNTPVSVIKDFPRGDTRKYKFTFRTKEVVVDNVVVTPSVPIDITDGTLFMTFKSRITMPDSEAEISVSNSDHDDATNGKSHITLSHDDTKNLRPGRYFVDCQFVSSSKEVTTLFDGTVDIKSDVTERIS